MKTYSTRIFTYCRLHAAVSLKCLVFTALVLANSAKANVIYDNLEAIAVGAEPVATWRGGPLYASFSSSASAEELTGVQLALSGYYSGSGAVTVGLYSDSSTAPGALIAPLGIVSYSQLTGAIEDYTLSLWANPVLTASTRYWIGLSDPVNLYSASWAYSYDISGTGVAGEYFKNAKGVFANSSMFSGNGPYTWAFQMKLSTGSSSVPVPDTVSTVYLLGLGFAGLVGLRRKLA